MKIFFTIFLLSIFFVQPSFSQVSFTANDANSIPPYTAFYRFGSNMGYYDSWSDMAKSDIAAGNPALNIKGAGVKSIHVPLPESFVTYWGYAVRLNEFNHYASLGLLDNTVFLEGPSADHRDDLTYSSCSQQSLLFKNMYEPIWDGGTNGTPVNENNYFAVYVYNTVMTYKNQVKFWEVINEPDFTWTSNGWQELGTAGNWWENNPQPCELNNMYTPIFQYIRLLRIAYEVVKTVDPTAYIGSGGIGYPSFLDAILRNTDNPVDGSVNSSYPNKGGAYFDVLSFHYYPHLNVKPGNLHSDGAVNDYVKRINDLGTVLNKYGYNGTTYPKKVWICSENGMPSKQIGGYMGSPDAEKNYGTKVAVESQANNISQVYVTGLAYAQDYATANNPFAVMGLYQNIVGIGPGNYPGQYLQQYSDFGIAYKTSSDILFSYRYDSTQTAAMAFPANVKGAAFRNGTGDYVYVLWAVTTIDNSETASATYSFPAAMNVSPLMRRREWNFSQTSATADVGNVNLPLTATPSFLSGNFSVLALDTTRMHRPAAEKIAFKFFPNPVKDAAGLQFTLKTSQQVTFTIYQNNGATVLKQTRLLNKGLNTLTFNLPAGTVPGIYYYRFQAGDLLITDKFVVGAR